MSEPYYADDAVTLYHGNALDVLREMPDASVNCCVTSPPYYGLRDYGEPEQYGLEKSPAAYVENMRALFAEVRRVLADDGTLWLNLGDSFVGAQPGRNDAGRDIGGRGGNKLGTGNPGRQPRRRDGAEVAAPRTISTKNLLRVPWRSAFPLQDDGWILRNAIVWAKPNAMPESVTDRMSTRHELIFLFSKRRRYWFDLDPIREDRAREARADIVGNTSKNQGNRARPANAMSVFQTGQYQTDGRNPGDYWEIPEESLTDQRGILSAEDAAYMAAFIDGEGSISIRRRKRQIQMSLTVVNTHEGVLRWMQERTGMGQIHQREIRNEKWRQCWEWCVSSRQAAQVIYAVLDHLRVKREQALVALHFMETTRVAGGGMAPAEYHDKRHAMAEDVAALNAGRITRSRFAVEPSEPQMSSAGSVWTIPTQPFPGAHFAVFPVEIPRRCIAAGCKPGGTVLDPFSGSGTTGLAAGQLGRKYIGIDLSAKYLDLSLQTRLAQTALLDGGAA